MISNSVALSVSGTPDIIGEGGGIYANASTVTINGSQIHDNRTVDSSDERFSFGNGGGIKTVDSNLNIDSSQIYGNFFYVGAIDTSRSNVEIRDSVIRDNISEADTSAGLSISLEANNTFSMMGSTVRSNSIGHSLYFDGSGSGSISGSAFDESDAGLDIRGSGSMTISNSSFLNNESTWLAALAVSGDVTLTLTHVTIANNRITEGFDDISGLDIDSGSAIVNLRNSIIAGNTTGSAFTPRDCKVPADGTLNVVNTLIQDGSCSATFSGDPLLGARVNSSTFLPPAYLPLLANSPALARLPDLLRGDRPARQLPPPAGRHGLRYRGL